MTESTDLSKRIILNRMTAILGNESHAIAWMNTLREVFDDKEGAWHSANEAIDSGRYDEVLAEVVRIETGVY